MISEPEAGQPSITSLVLCGGRGSRMDGRDKPLLMWRGEPLVAHILRSLPKGAVLISANRNHHDYAQFGWPLIADATPDLGPLGGIASAQLKLATDWLYVVPGDAPRLPAELASLLLAACQTQGTHAASVIAQRPHPLPLLVHRSALATLDTYLESGRRSVIGWLKTLASTELDQSQRPEAFANINTDRDLLELAQLEPPRS